MLKKNYFSFVIPAILFVVAVISCNYAVDWHFRQNYENANALLHADTVKTTYLKAHMKNGDVYIFGQGWTVDKGQTTVSGDARHYDFNRNYLSHTIGSIPIDSVAIFETNEPIRGRDRERIALLSIITAADVSLGIYCIANPKACFGSCPTFYCGSESNLFNAKAEGFSASICPSLEAADVDALNLGATGPGTFELTMKNEALETHAVNQVQLLAIPRKKGQRIFNDIHGNFLACSNISAPLSATVGNKDITTIVDHIDNEEYFSKSDSNNLAAREFVLLNFANTDDGKSKTLVVNFRQTLETTFLLYSAYGYMGDEVGDIFSSIERGKIPQSNISNPFALLGGIDVLVYCQRSKTWLSAGTIYETGPIAHNLQCVALPAAVCGQARLSVKLGMARGYWRLDYAALATIENTVEPLRLSPEKVVKNGADDPLALHHLLANDNEREASLPGDCYQLFFTLPHHADDYELFVYSKGYYLEWIRRQWLQEKNLLKLHNMLQNDPGTWLSLAREYKNMEADMETSFWGSKGQIN